MVDRISLGVEIMLEKGRSDVHWVQEASSLSVEGIENLLDLDDVSLGEARFEVLLWVEVLVVPCQEGRSNYSGLKINLIYFSRNRESS